MIYLKGFNNNVALVKENNQEMIIMGKGIGFQKLRGDKIDKTNIEKIFKLENSSKSIDRYNQLFNSIPMDDITLADEIIELCKIKYNKKFTDNILITLSDHINFAIKRVEQGIDIKNPLEWDIMHLYKEYVLMAKDAIRMIEDKRKVKLPPSEISHIAINFINGEIGLENMRETIEITEAISNILAIIEDYFNIKLNNETLNFTRFITHIKYFLLRQKRNSMEISNFNELFEMTRDKFFIEYNCVVRIEKYISGVYNWDISEDEKLYLIIHINRLTTRI